MLISMMACQPYVYTCSSPYILPTLIACCFLQAKHLAFLWYSYSELSVLMQLEILQSAIKQKDYVADLCKKGFLTMDMGRNFGDVCCKAILKICQQKKIPWQAEVCSWKDDKEGERCEVGT